MRRMSWAVFSMRFMAGIDLGRVCDKLDPVKEGDSVSVRLHARKYDSRTVAEKCRVLVSIDRLEDVLYMKVKDNRPL